MRKHLYECSALIDVQHRAYVWRLLQVKSNVSCWKYQKSLFAHLIPLIILTVLTDASVRVCERWLDNCVCVCVCVWVMSLWREVIHAPCLRLLWSLMYGGSVLQFPGDWPFLLPVCCSGKRSGSEEDLHPMDEPTFGEGLWLPKHTGRRNTNYALCALTDDRAAHRLFIYYLGGTRQLLSFIATPPWNPGSHHLHHRLYHGTEIPPQARCMCSRCSRDTCSA